MHTRLGLTEPFLSNFILLTSYWERVTNTVVSTRTTLEISAQKWPEEQSYSCCWPCCASLGCIESIRCSHILHFRNFHINNGWRFHFHTFKDPLVSVHSEGPMNVRAFIVRTGANREVRDWVSQGEHHLLLLVRHTRLLIDPPFSPHTPVLWAHPSLQFLQPLLHMRGHLQTAKMKSPLVTQDSTVEQMAMM